MFISLAVLFDLVSLFSSLLHLFVLDWLLHFFKHNLYFPLRSLAVYCDLSSVCRWCIHASKIIIKKEIIFPSLRSVLVSMGRKANWRYGQFLKLVCCC